MANRTIRTRRTPETSAEAALAFPAPPRGNVGVVLQEWVAVPFERLAHARRARAFHPRGLVLDARVVITDPGSALAGALGEPAERTAVVRVSKGAGTPGARADLLGIAVRIPLEDGRVFDLLFSSVGRHPGTRLVLAPSGGWCTRPYSTFLPYTAPGGRLLVGLEADDPGRAGGADPASVAVAVAQAPLGFAITEGTALRRPRPVGRLVLESVRDGDGGPSFDPMRNAHPRLRPVPFLSGVRERAYVGSRRGRAADPAALHAQR